MLLARLARDTEVHHAEADSDIDRFLFAARTNSDDYIAFLTRVYGFLAPLEAALAATPGLDGLVDLRQRAKAKLVGRDLVALGTPPPALARLPKCLSIPTFRSPAAALGWLYVGERPMLAAAVIRRHLSTRLPAEIERASTYLASYEGVVSARWRELGEAMQRVASTEALSDHIVDAAREAFRVHRRWRTSELDVRLAV